MGAFEKAWTTLKALPEQQMFSNPTQARTYGDSDYGEQERMGTVHPAIQGMLNRRGQYSMEVDRATPYQQTQSRMGLPPTHIQDVESYYEDEPLSEIPPKNSSQRALDELHADPDVEATDENLRMYAENPMRGARSKGNVGSRGMFHRYSENSAPYTAENMEEYMTPMAKSWETLKALPEQQVLGPDDQPLKTLHPAIQGMMERRGTLQPEGQEIQNIGHAPGFMPLSYGRDTSEAVYPRVGVPGREIRDDENFDTATERLTRERNEAIPTEGALQGGYHTSMRPQTDLTISDGYPYEIPERGIYTSEEGYPEYATDRHPYTARFASMYGEPETMDEKFKHGYGRFMGK